ncbi:Extracellular metalloprotease GLRG_06511 [Rhizoctonia solani]|uniref:Extracellular metalloprotease GLRG_06511 n=1 Tax=Rhizoctonia solani TaxID=456999 RepID=A0A0K6FUL5_9AGAM|nr:Extracellular metalloprotease GLRG_06511 [Rhizoctonia solani]
MTGGSRRTCGTVLKDDVRLLAESDFSSKLQLDEDPEFKKSETSKPVTLKVHWNVIAADKTYKNGYVPKSQIVKNIEATNKHYAKSGIRFKLVSVKYTINRDWFNKISDNSTEEHEAKSKLRKGGPADINVYTTGFRSGPEQDTLGYATFPFKYAAEPKNDGIVILFSTLPGGSKTNLNQGKTFTHELGHWLGLYHTFEGGCEGAGDLVNDTPPELEPAYGCEYGRDTCPGGGKDSIHNFMNYSDDACLTEFTPGQLKRIKQQIKYYRGVKF